MRGRPGIAARTFSALERRARQRGRDRAGLLGAQHHDRGRRKRDATRALQALHDEYQLDKLRPLADTTGRESKLTLLGFGQIGRALAEQLVAQEQASAPGARRRHQGHRRRRPLRHQGRGERLRRRARCRRLAKQKASGARLFAGGSPLTLAAAADDDARGAVAAPVAPADPRRPHLGGDRAAAAGGARAGLPRRARQQEAARGPADRVRPADADGARARPRRCATRRPPAPACRCSTRSRSCRRRATASRAILGCFSGTLGYLMTALEDGQPFSDAVREAWKLGYTEPDPRDDLSGTRRRAQGADPRPHARPPLELERHRARAALPPRRRRRRSGALRRQASPRSTTPFAERVGARAARRQGAALRRQDRRARHPRRRRSGARGLADGTACAAPTTRSSSRLEALHDNPLVVTGPGAGADVTAAGVLNDIVAITRCSERRRAPRDEAR